MTGTLATLTAALADRYVVERELGRGGMATVYLARDVKHGRLVALKVLDPELGASVGAERFLAEIRVTASLIHPNLLPLFDSGEAGGLLFYVMPYVRGETLRARLVRERELPIDDAIALTAAIAGALDHAHGEGVLHRDLKPENILLQDGQPVVADFGIALAVSNAAGSRATHTGMALGTPQYMSPEQAAGDRQLDARSDIYALAAMLYEMLTGEPPHTGANIGATMAKVMTETPAPLRARRDQAPVFVEWAVAKALTKRPADRFATAGEFAKALSASGAYEAALRSGAVAVVGPSVEAAGARRRRMAVMTVPWLIAAGFGVAAFVPSRAPTVTGGIIAPIRMVIDLPEHAERSGNGAVLPDGSGMVYLSTDQGRLYLARFDRDSATAIPGTERTSGFAISPDGAQLAIVQQGSLRTMPVGGGAARLLGNGGGTPAWLDNESIVVGGGAGLSIVRVSDGSVRALTHPDSANRNDRTHLTPVVIDGGKYVCFRATASGVTSGGTLSIVEVATGKRMNPDAATNAIAVGYSSGQLIYTTASRQLFAVELDLATGKLGRRSTLRGPTWNPTLTANGALTYAMGVPRGEIVSLDTNGVSTVVDSMPGVWIVWSISLSPDGTQLLAAVNRDTMFGVWMYDFTARRTSRATFGTSDLRVAWLPDGKRFLAGSGATRLNYADRRTEARIIDGAGSFSDVTPDGKMMVGSLRDTLVLRSIEDGHLAPFPNGVVKGRGGVVSRDGRQIAYVSDESGTAEVYVRAFQQGAGGERLQVSKGSGGGPHWMHDGRLMYRVGGDYYVARIRTSPALAVETPRKLSMESANLSGSLGDGLGMYAPRPDGRGVYLLRVARNTQQIGVVLNWITGAVRPDR